MGGPIRRNGHSSVAEPREKPAHLHRGFAPVTDRLRFTNEQALHQAGVDGHYAFYTREGFKARYSGLDFTLLPCSQTLTAPELEAVCRVAEFKEFRLRAGEKNVSFPSISKCLD